MIEIRKVVDPEEFEAVSRFRYSIYVEEMNRIQVYADHEKRTIVDFLDGEGACNLAAWSQGRVVGVVRNNSLRVSPVGDYFHQYGLDQLPHDLLVATSITTRLMVHPSFRSGTLAARLCCEAYRNAISIGITTDFIDGNDHLVPYFTALGYCVHRSLLHPEYGSVTVMRLNLLDVDHLERIRSPFRKHFQAWRGTRNQPSVCQETSCL